MSTGILVFAWVVAAGMLWLEIDAVAGRRRSEARWVAFGAHMWLAWVGTMPVWLHWMLALDNQVDPVITLQALANYGLLLVGYLMCLLAGVVIQERAA